MENDETNFKIVEIDKPDGGIFQKFIVGKIDNKLVFCARNYPKVSRHSDIADALGICDPYDVVGGGFVRETNDPTVLSIGESSSNYGPVPRELLEANKNRLLTEYQKFSSSLRRVEIPYPWVG